MGNLKGNRLMGHYWIVLPKKNRAAGKYCRPILWEFRGLSILIPLSKV
ncbi:MAG TPA: hypothetical protein PKA78_15035 [Macellibacteroides fermentans]|nr:hypothetical protein [Macellibacteroides fermentans]